MICNADLPNNCKHNERGTNAVYTAGDCFDNMAQGKCYGLEPRQGYSIRLD
jgi:hypothetical protein